MQMSPSISAGLNGGGGAPPRMTHGGGFSSLRFHGGSGAHTPPSIGTGSPQPRRVGPGDPGHVPTVGNISTTPGSALGVQPGARQATQGGAGSYAGFGALARM